MSASTLWLDGAPDIRLAADAFGEPAARTILMLHGGGQTRHAWHASAKSLAAAGWRAIAVDLRGHGESTHPRPAAYAPDDFAADVRALIAVSADPPLVIGASLAASPPCSRSPSARPRPPPDSFLSM